MQIVGGLSRTTKMPCHSWGLPAHNCNTGTKLARTEGTVCHDCYARTGFYALPRVQQAYERRLAKADQPNWASAMETLVQWQAEYNSAPYFRWFDSGDLQSRSMLDQIVEVARATPDIKHWLPTKEHRILRHYLAAEQPPDNLTIRVSAYGIDDNPPEIEGLPTSTVHRNEPPIGYTCRAYDTQPATCGPCRDCWDPTKGNVSYPYH